MKFPSYQFKSTEGPKLSRNDRFLLYVRFSSWYNWRHRLCKNRQFRHTLKQFYDAKTLTKLRGHRSDDCRQSYICMYDFFSNHELFKHTEQIWSIYFHTHLKANGNYVSKYNIIIRFQETDEIFGYYLYIYFLDGGFFIISHKGHSHPFCWSII